MEMKRFKFHALTVFVACVLLSSCSQEAALENLTSTSEQNRIIESMQMDITDYQNFFAGILSRAISENHELRGFIKEKALQRFDNDFNVFYHMVKNNIVSNDKTFRDVLMGYCEDPIAFAAVEESLPLLNIHIPDLKSFWEFNAYLWDISDNEVGVICKEDDSNSIFFEGEVMGTLDSMEIPGFPCLIVGNSDRIRISNKATRSSEATYEYVLDVFNPANTPPRTRHDYYDITVLQDSPYPYAKASELDPLVIAAFNEFKTIDDRHHQRENIFYGITKANPEGVFRSSFAETLFRFRVMPNQYNTISDQGEDAKYETSRTPGSGNGSWSTPDILKNLWNGKTFVIEFHVANPVLGQTTSPDPIPVAVMGHELFSFSKISVEYRNKTWFRKHQYTYTVNPQDLRTKWVDPVNLSESSGNPIFLTEWNWNLYNNSLTSRIYVYERDDDETIKETTNVSTEFAGKFDASLGFGTSQSKKIGLGFTYTTKNSSTIEISRNKKSDGLGNIVHDFRYPVIVDDSEKNTKGYKLSAINNGALELVIVPRRR